MEIPCVFLSIFKVDLYWYLENLIYRQHFFKMVNETSRSRPPSLFFDQTLIDGNEILSLRDWTSKQLHRKILWNWKKKVLKVSEEFFFHFNFIYLFFKSLTHGVEDERVDSGVNVAHRVSNNLIRMNI